MDAPAHCNPARRGIAECSADKLPFTCPALVDVPPPDHLIQPEDLRELRHVAEGYGRHRSTPAVYMDAAPGFSRAAAEYALSRLPRLRALAMDSSSSEHVDEAAIVHRVLLGCEGYSNRVVLLIQDARLPPELQTEGLDSAPCSMLAELPQ